MLAQYWADYVITSFSAREGGERVDIDIEKEMDGGVPPSDKWGSVQADYVIKSISGEGDESRKTLSLRWDMYCNPNDIRHPLIDKWGQCSLVMQLRLSLGKGEGIEMGMDLYLNQNGYKATPLNGECGSVLADYLQGGMRVHCSVQI